MQKNKKLIVVAVIVIVLIIAMAAVFFLTRPETHAGAKTVTVEVVHKDGSSETFTYHTDEEYLGPVILNEGLVKGDMGDFGLYILEVDGEVADYSVDKGWWALYLGEEMASTGADMIPIADGDSFSLVYSIG